MPSSQQNLPGGKEPTMSIMVSILCLLLGSLLGTWCEQGIPSNTPNGQEKNAIPQGNNIDFIHDSSLYHSNKVKQLWNHPDQDGNKVTSQEQSVDKHEQNTGFSTSGFKSSQKPTFQNIPRRNEHSISEQSLNERGLPQYLQEFTEGQIFPPLPRKEAEHSSNPEVKMFPFQDPSLPWWERVDDLLGRMTTEELIPQMIFDHVNPTPSIPHLGVKPYIWGSECLRGQLNTNTTAFPQAIGLAATFNPGLLHNISEAISYEVRAHWNNNEAQGIFHVQMGLSCLAPVVNIARHPLWGRNQETYGEDPYLSSQLTHAYIQGLQGDHPRYVRANAGCKAIAIYTGPEDIPSNRFSFNANVSQRDLHMTFLPQWKACVDAGSLNLMCSYYALNGTPSCIDKSVLTDTLRNDWQFQGYVISDETAITNIITQHHYLNDTAETAAKVVLSGMNMEFKGSEDAVFSSLYRAIDQGLITSEQIRQAARPIFYTQMRLGLFDPPGMNPYTKIGLNMIQNHQHRNIALKAAMQSFVLLKNDNETLPLKDKVKNLAIIGPFANNSLSMWGNYASAVVDEFTSTPLDSLSRLGHLVRYTPACNTTNTGCPGYNSSDVKEAVIGADLVIVCLGLGIDTEGEGKDRKDLNLPGSQLEILQNAVTYASGAPVVLLLFNAGPVNISWAKSHPGVSAILECFYPAQSTGEALYRTLTKKGDDSVPAGRLPITWPQSATQVPSMTNYSMDAGFTYRYFQGEPLYPFGYGLSYTKFRYSHLVVDPETIEPGQDVLVKVKVTNEGNYSANEVVQVYLDWGDPTLPAPRMQLAAFSRVHVPAGGSVDVRLTVKDQQMALYMDPDKGMQVLPRPMVVFVGGQQPFQQTSASSNVLQGGFLVLQPTPPS